MVLLSKQYKYKQVFVEFYQEWMKSNSVKIQDLLIRVKKLRKLAYTLFFFTDHVLWDPIWLMYLE